MLSPAAQHVIKVAKSAKKLPNERVLNAHESVLFHQFKSDRKRLAVIRSKSARDNEKVNVLKSYEQWSDELMRVDVLSREQKSMFVWLLLWRVDVGNWRKAVEMAAFAMHHSMETPEAFSRTLPETVAEQITDGITQNGDVDKHRAVLDELDELVVNADMTDQIRAKLYKACGLACMDTDTKRAKAMFTQALELNPRIGVKRLLKQIDKPKEEQKDDHAEYELSAREAARVLGVSLPTVLRFAKREMKQLPHIVIQQGSKTAYRFKYVDVKRYKVQVLDTRS